MKIIRRDILVRFVNKHSNTAKWIGNWIIEVEEASWAGPADIKARYSSASFLKSNVVIFNVKGNTYRLEGKVAYALKIIEVLWAGTHAEYEKRNKER